MSHKSDGRDEATRDREAYSVYDLLQSGWKPKPSDYATAPVLSNWRAVKIFGAMVLVGNVEGHPTLGPGEITTSALLAIDAGEGWCRTYGRYYRLGPQYTDDDVHEMDDGGVWSEPYFPGEEEDQFNDGSFLDAEEDPGGDDDWGDEDDDSIFGV